MNSQCLNRFDELVTEIRYPHYPRAYACRARRRPVLLSQLPPLTPHLGRGDCISISLLQFIHYEKKFIHYKLAQMKQAYL